MSYSKPDMTVPVDRLAHFLSERHNDNAPLGWELYKPIARSIIEKFDLEEAVLKAEI